jgi:peptidoglycan/xylan/chitin deacetylase (PgdA/CDA1 family)
MPNYGPQFYAPTIPGGGRTVALTFDDGPGPSTPAIIKILLAHGVRATFFNIGESETRWPNEVAEEADDGFLVANHSWSHPVMTGLSDAAQAAELDMVIQEQRRLVGSWPCAFRPPYGDYDDTTLTLARARHMAVWLWSVDTEDWKAEGSGSSYWVSRIISLAESEGGVLEHPVVLMHNQSIPMPATVAALPTVIGYFQRRGYTFIDLLGRAGPPDSCGSGPSEFAPSPSRMLQPGSSLPSGVSLVSPGGQYRLTMEHSGNLDLSVLGGRSLWSSDTPGHTGSTLTMRANGDLVVTSSADHVLWQSNTEGHHGARLEVRADGDLVVASASSTLWPSITTQSTLTPGERLEPGWYLQSPNMACRLIMEQNGNLTLYSGSRQPLWRSGTRDAPGASAVLQRDGAFDLFSKTWQRIFSLGTEGHPGAVLTLARLSQVVIRSRSGATLWSSG